MIGGDLMWIMGLASLLLIIFLTLAIATLASTYSLKGGRIR
jgi:hypothetical protein